MSKSSRTLVREQPHHEKAFEYYYALGEKRSYEKVAAEFNVSPSTVKLWGKSLRWKQRLKERDLQVARKVAGRSVADDVSHRERNLQIVHMALVQLARAVADGEVKMSLGDLDKLIRLESFLRDEPDSRQEIVVADLRNKSAEELKAMIGHELEQLAKLQENSEGGSIPSMDQVPNE